MYLDHQQYIHILRKKRMTKRTPYMKHKEFYHT
eukprot:SAG25_NODE_14999_length_190_cov_69.813187_1_plen_32_part_01